MFSFPLFLVGGYPKNAVLMGFGFEEWGRQQLQ